MPNFEAKISTPKVVPDNSEKPDSKRSALEQTLDKVLEGGQNIGAFARKEFSEILERIPELPITDTELENLQKSDPEVAAVLLKEQDKILNEIGVTLEAIREAERNDPHSIHFEKVKALYENLDRLEKALPLMNVGVFNNKVLGAAPVPSIELARLKKAELLQKNISGFLRANLSAIREVMPEVFIKDIDNFTRGLATGIVEVGADITAFFEMITENPEQFLRSFKLLAKYLYDQGPYEVIAKLHSTAVDKTLSFIDSTAGNNGENLAFDTGYIMTNFVTLLIGSVPIKLTLTALKSVPKLTPQLTDPIALIEERKNYSMLVHNLSCVYPKINTITLQKTVAGFRKILSTYPKVKQAEIVNDVIESQLYGNAIKLFENKKILGLILETAQLLPTNERKEMILAMIGIENKSLPDQNTIRKYLGLG